MAWIDAQAVTDPLAQLLRSLDRRISDRAVRVDAHLDRDGVGVSDDPIQGMMSALRLATYRPSDHILGHAPDHFSIIDKVVRRRLPGLIMTKVVCVTSSGIAPVARVVIDQ